MNQCLICKLRKTHFYTKINRITINECTRCKLAYTLNPPKTKNLYDGKTIYSLSDYLSLKEFHEKKAKRIANNIYQIVPKGDVLEVGGGFGLLSNILFKRNNYHLEVIEPNLPLDFIKDNKKIIKHKKTYEGFLSKNKKNYDCVIFIDVLEHFKRPDMILRKTRRILKKNGHLVLQFPNYKSIMAKICKNWSWWMIEDHKFHFSTQSAGLLLEKEGYKIVFLETHEEFYDFKKNLDGNFIQIKNNITRKMCKLIYFSTFVPLYFLLRQLFWRLGYGGLIFLIAQKD